MNISGLKKRFIIVVFVYITIFGTSSCEKEKLVDPFWEINIEWDKKTITNMLFENSRKGKITNCVFSFEKEFYVKKADLDAKIIASLNYPTFAQNDLKLLNYSLVAEFKDETISQFNPVFFNYFKNKMISVYGHMLKEYEEDDKIGLAWKIENKKTVKATIIKDINHYIISVMPKN